MNNLANLLYKQGKLEEARLRSLGYPEVAKVSRGRQFRTRALVSFLSPEEFRLS